MIATAISLVPLVDAGAQDLMEAVKQDISYTDIAEKLIKNPNVHWVGSEVSFSDYEELVVGSSYKEAFFALRDGTLLALHMLIGRDGQILQVTISDYTNKSYPITPQRALALWSGIYDYFGRLQKSYGPSGQIMDIPVNEEITF